MTERQWELYRLSVVQRMPDSDYKTAVLAGITYKLTMLDQVAGEDAALAKLILTSTPDELVF
jgi:hypothetical protein